VEGERWDRKEVGEEGVEEADEEGVVVELEEEVEEKVEVEGEETRDDKASLRKAMATPTDPEYTVVSL